MKHEPAPPPETTRPRDHVVLRRKLTCGACREAASRWGRCRTCHELVARCGAHDRNFPALLAGHCP